MQSILITGAYGVLGSEIVKALIRTGLYKIAVLVKSSTSSIRLSKDILDQIEIFEFDKHSLDEIFIKNKIDHIIHTATSYGRSELKAELIQNNVVFPIRLIELAQKYNTISFINTDSYFNKFQSYEYLGSYVLTKRNLEEWLQQMQGIKIFNLKLEHIYASNDTDRKFVNNIFKQFIDKKELIKLTEGNQKRDFIHISDVVNFYSALLISIENFENGFYQYEIGTGVSTSIKEFILKMNELFKNNKTKLQFGAIDTRRNDIIESKADLSKIPPLIDWQPQIDITNGLKLLKEQWMN